MPDPFAAALAVLHGAAGSVAAVYTPPGGAPLPLRVVREQGSEDLGERLGRTIVDTELLVIRRADVAMPVAGAIVAIGADRLKLQGGPMLDTEGLSWRCPAVAG